MRKAWFVYQMGSIHPVPCIIYDHLPDDAAGKSSLKPKIIQTHELTEAHGRDQDGEVMASFAMLMTEFPYTGDAYEKPAKISLDDRKDILTKATDALLAELG